MCIVTTPDRFLSPYCLFRKETVGYARRGLDEVQVVTVRSSAPCDSGSHTSEEHALKEMNPPNYLAVADIDYLTLHNVVTFVSQLLHACSNYVEQSTPCTLIKLVLFVMF